VVEHYLQHPFCVTVLRSVLGHSQFFGHIDNDSGL
jgi:hypothetical protein